MGRTRSKRRKKRGCFFWGCLSVTGVFTLLISAFALLIYLYMGREPIPVPPFTPNDLVARNVQERIKLFEKALDEGKRAEISFTGDELNTIIKTQPEFARIKDQIYLFIDDGEIKGQVNFTPDMFSSLTPWMNIGMWLNGIGTFGVFIEEGEFHVHLEHLELEKRQVPEFIMIPIREENLAARMPIGPKRKTRLRKIGIIEVKNEKVYIRSRGNTTLRRLELPQPPAS